MVLTSEKRDEESRLRKMALLIQREVVQSKKTSWYCRIKDEIDYYFLAVVTRDWSFLIEMEEEF